MADKHIPGATISVVKNGQVFFQKGYGDAYPSGVRLHCPFLFVYWHDCHIYCSQGAFSAWCKYWKAYRKRDRKQLTAYIGKSETLSLDRLEQVAQLLDRSVTVSHIKRVKAAYSIGKPEGSVIALIVAVIHNIKVSSGSSAPGRLCAEPTL